MIRCQQPQAHPDRCGCSPAGTEQVSSAWLAQLREEYRLYAQECERLRGELQHRDKLLAEMQTAWDTALEAGKLMNDQLTAIRQQEPVAWQSRFTDEEWAKCSRGHFDWVRREPEAFPRGYEARELYALPPQQLGAEERDVPLHAAINRACGELPDGWSIEVNAERDGAWVALLNAELEVVEFPTNNERLDYTVNDAVEFALLSTRQPEVTE